ncbi:MAG: hypothetical protein PVSMB1_05780 [Gemmatimonadaceae bacterium]
MPYRLSSLAERDLDEIWSYVAEDASPATADRLIDAIIERLNYWWNSLGSVVSARSSARVCDRSQSKITSSTIDTTGTSYSLEFSTVVVIKQPPGLSDHGLAIITSAVLVIHATPLPFRIHHRPE